MRQLINRFCQQRGASVSIEFAMILPFLLFLFLLTLELSRIMLISSSLDLLSTELSRKTAIAEPKELAAKSYQTLLNEQLIDELGQWTILADVGNVTTTLSFCESVDDIVTNRCTDTISDGDKLILFKIKYDYPIFFSSLFNLSSIAFDKKAVVYREYY